MKRFHEINEPIKSHIILLDIDGTITGEGDEDVPKESLQKIAELKQSNRVYFCSNGTNEKRKARLSKRCGLICLPNHWLKPDARIATLVENPKKHPFLVIGNLYCRDGKLAKNIGGRFIKVHTILGEKEAWIDRIFYKLDDVFLRFFI